MGVGHAVLVAVAKVDASAYGDDWRGGAEGTEESAGLVHDMLAARFPAGNLHRLYTRDATCAAVRERVEALGAAEGDLVVLYLTCHGGHRTLSGRREQALYLRDRKLGVSELATLVERLPCRCVVIADACHTRDPPRTAAPREMAGGERELLYYGAAVGPTDGNLFTRLLTELAPTAANYRELATHLQAAARASGGLQEPVFYGHGASGSFLGSRPFAI